MSLAHLLLERGPVLHAEPDHDDAELDAAADLHGLRAPGLLADPSATSDIRDAEEDALCGCLDAARWLASIGWPVPRLLSGLLADRGCRWEWAGRPNRINVLRGDELLLAKATPRSAALWAAAQ